LREKGVLTPRVINPSFLTQLSPGQGDYLEWQDQIFGDASVDEIYEQARKHWERLEDEGSCPTTS